LHDDDDNHMSSDQESSSEDESDKVVTPIKTPVNKSAKKSAKKRAKKKIDYDKDDEVVDVDDADDDGNVQPMDIEGAAQVPDIVSTGPTGQPEQPIVRIPRQWQMKDADMVTTLQAYVAFRMRLQSFVRLPVISRDDDEELWEQRTDELQYLGQELLAIWSTGCSSGQPVLDDDNGQHAKNKSRSGNTKVDPMGIAFCLFFHRTVDINLSPVGIDAAKNELWDDVNELVGLHKRYNFDNEKIDGPHTASLRNVYNIAYAVQNAHHMLQHAFAMSIALDPSKNGITPSKNVLHIVHNMNSQAKIISDSQNLTKVVKFLIQVAATRGLRRYRNGVYEQHFTPEGHPTHFWKRVSSMQNFVLRHTSSDHKEINDIVAGRCLRAVNDLEAYLNKVLDPQFLEVKIDRHVFSFRNGIYFAATRTFRPYTDNQMNWKVDSKVPARLDIGRMNAGILNEEEKDTNASANYFDCDFTDYTPQIIANKDSWFDIQTPTVEKLLDDQKIPVEVKKVVYGLLGRTLYEVGEMDDWQIILWFLGHAGTGKSTICKIPSLFYQPDDVAVISNNIEEQFGLAPIYDKLVYVAPEVKKDFRLNQAQFQSMVSGEKMSIARKFKDAETVAFKPPGLVAGNAMPTWMDNSDSLARRIVLVACKIPVGKVDSSIGGRLAMEVAALIYKCNIAYHMMVEDYGTKGVWECLPKYFKDTRNDLKAKTHPMYHFLSSDEKFIWGSTRYITVEKFKTYYNDHVRKNNLKRGPWTEELYMTAFAERHLRIEKRKNVFDGDKMVSEAMVVAGVAWKDDEEAAAHAAQQAAAPNVAEMLQPLAQNIRKELHIGTYGAIPKTVQF